MLGMWECGRNKGGGMLCSQFFDIGCVLKGKDERWSGDSVWRNPD